MADSATPPRQFKALGAESGVFLQLGMLLMAGGALFGAGAWANSISNGITSLTSRADKTEATLDKIQTLIMDLRTTPPRAPSP